MTEFGELVVIFLSMALLNNFILTKFLGLCPFFGVSKKVSNAVSMGIAVVLVMTVAATITWPIYSYILVPYELEYMYIVIFILIIASTVQIIEMTIKRTNPKLYNALGIYLPLITTNCAVLGVTVLNIQTDYNFLESIVSAVGAGTGFILVLFIMSGIRERLELADIPQAMKGIPIAMMVAALLGLAFMGFGGMV